MSLAGRVLKFASKSRRLHDTRTTIFLQRARKGRSTCEAGLPTILPKLREIAKLACERQSEH